MISTFRDRSRSPGRSAAREKGPETSDHPLSTSWWGEKKHSEPKKKKRVSPEQTEALRSTQRVSNSVFLDSVSSRAGALCRPDADQSTRYIFSSLEDLLMTSLFIIESCASHRICIGNCCRYNS